MTRIIFKLLFVCVLFAAASAAFAASAAEPVVSLEVKGAEKPAELRVLDIRSEITGRLARTTVEMTFYNPNGRVLEGELQFPLRSGQAVTGFALEMGEGKKSVMRDAVPVEKAKGRQVFEEITRRNVDPALLEVTQGNNFKIRVYPLNPGQTRRVRVTYDERLFSSGPDSVYILPLAYAGRVEKFNLSIRIANAPRAPQINVTSPIKTSVKNENGSFIVTASGENARLSDALELSIPARPDSTAFLGERDGVTYFYAEIPAESIPRPMVKAGKKAALSKVSVLWDASASGRKRDHIKEFAFLDAFFAAEKNITVTLQQARDAAEQPMEFEVRNGDWSVLRAALESVIYDGATNLSAFDVKIPADMFFLFSDGLDNYSGAPMTAPEVPLFALVSAPGADTSRLNGIAARSGGSLLDLSLFTPAAALSETRGIAPAKTPSVQGGVTDVIYGSAAIAGIVRDKSQPVRVTFEGNAGAVISLSDAPYSEHVPFIWASMKLERLEEEYDLNRGEIRRIGKNFNMATRETSLIVLDTAEDYVRYDIEPPAELKQEYDRLRAASVSRRTDTGKLLRVLAEWRERQEWWKKDFPKDAAERPNKKPSNEMESRAQAGAPARSAPMDMMLAAPGIGGAGGAPGEFRSLMMEAAPAEPVQQGGRGGAGENISIALRPWTPDAPYIRRMREASGGNLYRIYLDERPDWENSVAFYLDAADQLKQRGQEALSLRVLSNLAEMNLENRQILRVLGYRLMEAGKANQAVVIFTKVLNLGEEEPQSYRDLGLALAAAGEPQKAVERLYDAVEKDFPRNFPGIEVIALTELNAIIAASAATVPKGLDTSPIDQRFLNNMPLDLRAVLTWDADNTDIDMHVIDPDGEEVYYGYPLSWQGGRISPDNTAGWGPEEFSLRQAKPGKYRVEVNFYGHSQQIISDSTTIQLDFFTRYGTPQQQKQSVTMRLRDAKDRIVVGEFEVK